jgi:hypothetical protein
VLSGKTRYAKAGMGIRKDGRAIDVSVTIWPIHNSAGDVEAISVIARDVSLQYEAEKVKGLLVAMIVSPQMRQFTPLVWMGPSLVGTRAPNV